MVLPLNVNLIFSFLLVLMVSLPQSQAKSTKAKDDVKVLKATPDRFSRFKDRPNPPTKANDVDINDIGSEDENDENVDPDENEKLENEYFGRGKKAFRADESKKNPKHVTLNPETAFGPEVVTSFDFPNIDILELTKHMQKLTGLNLILDKDVKGKISILAPSPITVGEAWKAYLTALNVNNLTLIKTGSFYKIVQARDARYYDTSIYMGEYTPDTENYVMRIVKLKNVDAKQISQSFRMFSSRHGRIIEIVQTNSVIILDTGTMVNRLVKMINFIDVPGHEETLQIIQVKNSSADEIAKMLSTILSNKPGDMRFRANPAKTSQIADISKIIAEPRTNSIIAMANQEGAKQLRSLIEKLDVQSMHKGGGKIHVHYLNYSDSETVAKTLSSIVTSSGSGSKNNRSRLGIPGVGGGDEELFSSPVKISPDKSNNAIVVMASPTDYLTLKKIINKLDIPRDQVYVEGMIMETSLETSRNFGVTIMGKYGHGVAQTYSTDTGGGPDLLKMATSSIPGTVGGIFSGIGIGREQDIPAQGTTLKVNRVNALIKALAKDTGTNILATPQILALDNEDAVFENGETVPTLLQTIANNGATSNSFKEQEIKLSLKLTPQINKVTRNVKLKIDFSFAEIKGAAAATPAQSGGVPTTNRKAVTTVIVRDRDTVAMGGLMRDTTGEEINKVPLLGDIPVLGWLFKSRSKSVRKVNLLLFLTPKILMPYEKTAATTMKDILNRRAHHLKSMGDNADPFASTSKGLYDKASKQEHGPLYDQTQTTAGRLNDNNFDMPDYQSILREKSLENQTTTTTTNNDQDIF